MNASDATGPLSRYGPQSVGRGDRMTSSPSLRMNTSSVVNWNSFGSRTAWLRLVMKTLARRGMVGPPVNPPYTLVYAILAYQIFSDPLPPALLAGKAPTASPAFLAFPAMWFL